MKLKRQISILTVLLMLLTLVFPFTGIEKVKAAADVQMTFSPAFGGSLGGTTGEISITFSQPVEWYGQNTQVQIYEDTDKDGDGDVVVPGNGPSGTTHINCVTLSEDGYKAVLNINDQLQPDKYYVILVLPQLKLKGTETTDDTVLPQIGDGYTHTGWNFNTVIPLTVTSTSPASGASLGGITNTISVTFNKSVEIFKTSNQALLYVDQNNNGFDDDDRVPLLGSGMHSNVMALSSDEKTVIISINDLILNNKCQLIIAPNLIRAKGSTATKSASSDQVWAGTTLLFDTYAVQSVTITGDSSVVEGNTLNLTAEMKDISNNVLTGEEVTWSSGNTMVAAVDVAGAVTALEPGTSVITATSKTNPNAKDTLEITVTSAAWRILNTDIGNLPDAENITLANEATVTDLLARYGQLSEIDKAKVTNYQKLAGAKAKIDKIHADQTAADAVISKISTLPASLTLADKAKVEEARSAYTALTNDQKALVTNLNVLQNAETRISQLEASKAQAQVVIDQIDALGTITLEKTGQVSAARTAYTNLSQEAKDFVTNLPVLAAAESRIAQLTADKDAADAVISQINSLPETPVLSDASAVEAARAAYTALTADQKVLVTNLAKLEAAEAAVNKLKSDKEAADAVILQISNLPAVISLTDGQKISAARSAYGALTADQKGLVTNLSILTAAEQSYEKLAADNAAADAVDALIAALPQTLTLSDSDAVAAAEEAYDALTLDQKILVENYGRLSQAAAEIATLKAQKEAEDKAIKEIKESENRSVTINTDGLAGLSPDILEAIKESKKEVTFVKEENGKTLYSWTFNGSRISDIGSGFSLNIGFSTGAASSIDKLAGNADSLYIHFDYHGALPAPAQIKLYVGNKYSDGARVNLYYYNDETGKAEEITKGLEVKDGYVTFTITHCSDYFLTAADLSAAPQGAAPAGTGGINSVLTGDAAPLALFIMIFAGSLSVLILFKRRRVS